MDPLARRVALRWAYKYQPKEKKEHKVDRIRERTGLSKGQAEAIADAYVRGRDVERLALQKSWPLEGGVITGPSGILSPWARASHRFREPNQS